MKSIIEFISNMEILLLHVEEFCDHSEEKTVFRDKCGNFTSNLHRNFRVKFITEFVHTTKHTCPFNNHLLQTVNKNP